LKLLPPTLDQMLLKSEKSALIEDYVPENNSEIGTIKNRVKKDIKYFLNDENNGIRMFC